MEIDLEKYAGHTPGPWAWDGEDYCGLDGPDRDAVLTYRDFEGMHLTYGDSRQANARLIADAPALLAEVVKLRAGLDEAVQTLEAIEIAARMRFSPADILDENSPIREGMRAVLAKHGGA